MPKAVSLPSLNRLPGTMEGRALQESSNKPAKAVQIRGDSLSRDTAKVLPSHIRDGRSMLPKISERPGSSERPTTSGCKNFLESSMGFKKAAGDRKGRGARPGGAQNSLSLEWRPATSNYTSLMSVSSGLEKWPARSAARARMGSLKHFTATPPRPISAGRPQVPAMNYMGMCAGVYGGQVWQAEDWHFRKNLAVDKRMPPPDRVAGDLSRLPLGGL